MPHARPPRSPVSASAPRIAVHDPDSAVPKTTTYRTIDSAASAPITATMTIASTGGSTWAIACHPGVQRQQRETGADQPDADEIRRDHQPGADQAADQARHRQRDHRVRRAHHRGRHRRAEDESVERRAPRGTADSPRNRRAIRRREGSRLQAWHRPQATSQRLYGALARLTLTPCLARAERPLASCCRSSASCCWSGRCGRSVSTTSATAWRASGGDFSSSSRSASSASRCDRSRGRRSSASACRSSSALAATISGDAIGNITPLSLIVSEPAKAIYLREDVPVARSFAALTAENFFYSVSVALFIVLGHRRPARALRRRRPAGEARGDARARADDRRPGGGALDRVEAAGVRQHRRSIASPAETRRHRSRASASSRRRRTTSRSRRTDGWAPSCACELAFHLLSFAESYYTLWLITGVSAPVAAFVLDTFNRIINVVFRWLPGRVGVDEYGTQAAGADRRVPRRWSV